MAQYDVVQACGHEVHVNLTGKHSYREWRLDKLKSEVCTDCWKQQQHERDAARAAELQLPAWTSGSPDQRGWAESIRLAVLAKLEEEYGAALRAAPDEEQRALVATVYATGRAHMFEEHTDARYWIDEQYHPGYGWFRRVLNLGFAAHPDLDPRSPQEHPKDAPVPPTTPAPAPKPVAPPPPSYTLRPAGAPITASIATATYDTQTKSLVVRLPEMQPAFRELLRGQDFTWSPDASAWLRKLPATAGDPVDRVAEIAARIAAAGFIVRLRDAEAYQRAVDGSYTPEQRRWVYRSSGKFAEGRYEGWFLLVWPRSDDLYDAAIKLRGARWRNGNMLVPPGSADEVVEFAEVYEFALSEKAQAIVNEVREALAHGIVPATPKKQHRRKSGDNEKLPVGHVPPVLAVPEPGTVGIADALRDDE